MTDILSTSDSQSYLLRGDMNRNPAKTANPILIFRYLLRRDMNRNMDEKRNVMVLKSYLLRGDIIENEKEVVA